MIESETSSLSTPPPAGNAEVRTRLAEAPAVLRNELLRRADRGRDGSADEIDHALEVYRALLCHLDPADALDASRILWAIQNSRSADRAFEDVCRSAVENGATEELRLRASLRLGRLLDYGGDPSAARIQLFDAWRTVKGTGSHLEGAALFHLTNFELAKGRLLESLLHCLRLVDVARRGPEPRGEVMARTAYAAALLRLHEVSNAREQICLARELVAGLPENVRERAAIHVDGVDAQLALHEGRFEDALFLLGPPRPVGDGRPGQGAWRDWARAVALTGLGRSEEALERLDRAQTCVESLQDVGLNVRLERARCLGRVDRVAEALHEAEALMLELDAVLDAAVAPYNVCRFASELATLFVELRSEDSWVQRAEEVAATAAIQRLVEIDRMMLELETAGELPPEGSSTFGRVRHTWLDEQHALLDRVAKRLQTTAAEFGLEALRPLLDATVTVSACAWCRRIKTDAGRWLPIAAFLPQRAFGRVTHGMCDDCAVAFRATF